MLKDISFASSLDDLVKKADDGQIGIGTFEVSMLIDKSIIESAVAEASSRHDMAALAGYFNAMRSGAEDTISNYDDLESEYEMFQDEVTSAVSKAVDEYIAKVGEIESQSPVKTTLSADKIGWFDIKYQTDMYVSALFE